MRRRWKGSFTVEASVIVPVLLFLCVTAITTLFYYHDKVVLEGVARETASFGTCRQEKTEQELKQTYEKLVKGKLLWFPKTQVQIRKSASDVEVSVQARHRGMSLKAKATVPLTKPEQKLRRKELIYEHTLQK